MVITILGTGTVGMAHAEKLLGLGHKVTIGTRDVEKTLSLKYNPQFGKWYKKHKLIDIKPFGEAIDSGEIIINALRGEVVIEVLSSFKDKLRDKLLIDVSNPLVFSKESKPSLSVCNTDSLGEMIQRLLPDTFVVKAFNTLNASLQTNPKQLNNAIHDLFICGNNLAAKEKVVSIAKSYGWTSILDLGDISSARGMEMFLPLWLQIWSKLGTAQFNVKIIK